MSDLLKELYQEIILDHGKGLILVNVNHLINPLKDTILYVVTMCMFIYSQTARCIIKDIKFTGVGCAISIASTSLMTQSLKGKSTEYANNLFNDFSNLITGKYDELNIIDEEDSLYSLKGVGAFPMRVKCATLSWHAFKSAIDDKK